MKAYMYTVLRLFRRPTYRLLVDLTEITTLVTLHISLTLILSNALYGVFLYRLRLFFFPKRDLLCDIYAARLLRFVYLLRNNCFKYTSLCMFSP